MQCNVLMLEAERYCGYYDTYKLTEVGLEYSRVYSPTININFHHQSSLATLHLSTLNYHFTSREAISSFKTLISIEIVNLSISIRRFRYTLFLMPLLQILSIINLLLYFY